MSTGSHSFSTRTRAHAPESASAKRQPAKPTPEPEHTDLSSAIAFLQSAIGNQATNRLVDQPVGANPEVGLDGGPISDTLARRIQASRGGGQAIDERARRTMEDALGSGFGDVRIHTNHEADEAAEQFVDDTPGLAVEQPGAPLLPSAPSENPSQSGTIQRLPAAMASSLSLPSADALDDKDMTKRAGQMVLELLRSDPDDRSGRVSAALSQLQPDERATVLNEIRPQATPDQLARLSAMAAGKDEQNAAGDAASQSVAGPGAGSGPNGTAAGRGIGLPSIPGSVGPTLAGLTGPGPGLVVSPPVLNGLQAPATTLASAGTTSAVSDRAPSATAGPMAAPDNLGLDTLGKTVGGEAADLDQLKAPTEAQPASATASAPAGETPPPATPATGAAGPAPGTPAGAGASANVTTPTASPTAESKGAPSGGKTGAQPSGAAGRAPGAAAAAHARGPAHGAHGRPGATNQGQAAPVAREENAVVQAPTGATPPGNGLAAMATGNLALVDEELAEHQRWAAASSQVGAADSTQRAAFVAEQAGGGVLSGFAQGAAMGLGMGLAVQAAEFIPIPGVGSILGGAMAVYGLANRDWSATAATIGRFGEGSDTYEMLANSIASVSEIIDLAVNIMQVIAGILGIISAVMWIITVVTVGVAAPLAGTLSAIALAITEVSGILGLINSLILQPCVMLFRALHTFTSQADPRDVEAQGGEIAHAAASAGGALGGLAGGALASGARPPPEEEPLPHPQAETPTTEPIPAAAGEGPTVQFEEPPVGAGGPGIGEADTQMLPTGPGATEAETQMLPAGPGAAEAETQMLPTGPGAADAETQMLPAGPGATEAETQMLPTGPGAADAETQMLPAGPGATEAATSPGMPAATEPQAGPAPPRNPVMEMTAVNPAEVYPGAPQPPGFQAGPVGTVEPPAPAPRDNNVQIWQNVAAPGEGNVQIWQNILEPPTGAPPSAATPVPTELPPTAGMGTADTVMAPGGPGAVEANTQMVPTGPGAVEAPTQMLPTGPGATEAQTQMLPTGPGATEAQTQMLPAGPGATEADTQMLPAGPGASEAPTERAPWNPDLENPQIPPPPGVPQIESPGDFGIEEPQLPPQPSPYAPTELPPAPEPSTPLEETPSSAAPSGPTSGEPAGGGGARGGGPVDEGTGMRVESLPSENGAAERDWANVTDQDIEDWAAGIDDSARSETFFEMDAAGLQDITTNINDNPGQIAYNVNHYMSDVSSIRIADASEVPIGAPRGPGGSVIPEGVGTEAEPVPPTYLANPDDTPVLNANGEPIGQQNVEVRYHSANPRAPEGSMSRTEPSVQINTPSDRFGWAGNRDIAVEGETGRYMTPDGRWVTMGRGTSEADRAAAHFPVGRSAAGPTNGPPSSGGGAPPSGGAPPPPDTPPGPGLAPTNQGGGTAAASEPSVIVDESAFPPGSIERSGPTSPRPAPRQQTDVDWDKLGTTHEERMARLREPEFAPSQQQHDGTQAHGPGQPHVERVNPNYPPPPGTPQQLKQIQDEIENILAARARAEQAEQRMAAQEQRHQANQGPIGKAVQETAGGITAVQAHEQAVARRQQANQEQQQRQQQSQSLVSGYPSRAAGISALRIPLAAFQGFTHIASELPGDAGAAMLRMSHDADRLDQAFHQMDLSMNQQADAAPARQQELANDQSRLQTTGQQAQSSGQDLQKANAGAEALKQANETKLREAQQAKQEAGKQKTTLDEAADAKQKQAQTLAEQLQAWANEHKQVREKTLEETRKNLEDRGYVVREVRES